MSSGKVNYVLSPLGVFDDKQGRSKGIQIRYASEKENCGIILYDRKSGKEMGRYAFEKVPQDNRIYELFIEGVSLNKIAYQFYEENKPVIDKKALMFAGEDAFGCIKGYSEFRSISLDREYDWEGDYYPRLNYTESIGYCLHVRGFTKHKSSKVKAKGTFRGVVEKLPYLKELGITTLELQPAYEFIESALTSREEMVGEKAPKINYWGYKEAFYYVPKRAYAYGKDSSVEFKDMVKAIHANKMEVIMQFYFPDNFSRMEIIPVLRYWHQEYHVDGFHIKGNALPLQDIVQDPYLNNAKVWCADPNLVEHLANTENGYKRLGVYHDEYMCKLRGFLKSDEDMLEPAVRCMMRNPSGYGVINYLSNYYGFTMADMVCFQEKHNWENGEENRDGSDYNCTWNCGVEGNTRKKHVLTLRKRQLYNAFALLFLSQGMPLLFMGDEFANSQNGNNNPYCQDNIVTWLDWKGLEKNVQLFHYVKQLIQLRKDCRVFANESEYTMTDYLSLGTPDLSYHDEEAWKYSLQGKQNSIGIMINGNYVKDCEGTFWYIALNTHWEEEKFAFPDVGEGLSWELCFSTGSLSQNLVDSITTKNNFALVEPRCICIFRAKADAQEI